MSLYRKYRSQKFEDIIGQEHIVQTLKGALESSNIGHAYIFSGMRGTGKTSIARIFAKAVNCINSKNGEPCGECSICKETTAGNFLDLIEIDAASNRGIDDIRDLREKIKFSPNIGKYKIYIIDEVHMLTTDAFNALLKTLEEPPSHAIFILATTEIHKVPATILSRCQRLDFHKIELAKMLDGIKKISVNEKINIGDDGLRKIASLSEGSMRDALSLLDQVSSFAHGGDVSFSLLEDILGVAGEDEMLNIMDMVVRRDIKSLLESINEMVNHGKDIESFVKESIRFARKILMIKTGNQDNVDILNLERGRIIAENISLEDLVSFIDVLNSVLKNTRFSFIPQLSLEIEIIKMLGDKKTEKKTEIIPVTADKENEEKKKRGIFNIIKKESEIDSPEMEASGSVQSFLEKVKNEKVMLYTFIRSCIISEDGDSLRISTSNPFCFNSISEKNNNIVLENIAKEVFGENKKIFVSKSKENMQDQPPKKDLVSEALNIFGGELIE